ncbi:MAG: hypothetical protein JSU73_10760 [candidate division WOR-3 bacterium]|nr:MAG: hypothetical protein JSU73_10760 [candidate division WOR-3 bacterium]
MSKYQELSEVYKKEREKFTENEQQCREFVTGLVRLLAEYLECDPGLFEFHLANVKFDPANSCSMEEALAMGMDGSWHFMLGFRLCAESNIPPCEVVHWEMSVNRGPAGFELRLHGVHEPYRWPPNFQGRTKTHDALFERLYKAIRHMYTEGFTRFTDTDRAGRQLKL